jgi:excisionase family DNA binding protein
MDRLVERLAVGRPPLRVSELARALGVSEPFVRKQIDCEVIRAVTLPGSRERRIPVQEAERLARDLRMLE